MSGYHDLRTEVDVRRAQQVAYSLLMVADVAAGYNDALDRGDMLLARCMLDSFYVHARLLSEFFLRTTPAQDFGPSDFGVEWAAPTGEGPERLNEAWRVASAYVVHFSDARVPNAIEDLRAFTVNAAYFQGLALDLLECYELFATDVRQAAPPWDRGALIPDREQDPVGWRARVAQDVVLTLDDAAAEARTSLAGAGLK